MTILRSDPAGVALVLRRSFADYLWRLVERSARPYGLKLVEARQCPDAFLSPLLSASAQLGQRKAA
jgi:sarcosine oxidase subunit gamma